MENNQDPWTEYWAQDDFWKDSLLWKINAELFLRRADKMFAFNRNQSVLNIGCGPGYLEPLLAPKVKRIHALDTAERFADLCKKNCLNHPNVTVGLLGRNYTDLTVCGDLFSVILCVSVVQYYKNMTEIEALITSARDIALPGARMLIADLPLKPGFTGFAWDVLCSFFLSVREGYNGVLVRTALSRWLQRSRYLSFRSKTRELYFDIPTIESLIHRLGLNAKIVRKNLSVYANRPSLLIQF
jgi:SAM-dependent methyltransferase